MALDKRNGDSHASFADASDMSSPVETLVLDPAATSLHDAAHAENTASSSGLHQPDQIVLEAHPSRDDGVSGVSFRCL